MHIQEILWCKIPYNTLCDSDILLGNYLVSSIRFAARILITFHTVQVLDQVKTLGVGVGAAGAAAAAAAAAATAAATGAAAASFLCMVPTTATTLSRMTATTAR